MCFRSVTLKRTHNITFHNIVKKKVKIEIPLLNNSFERMTERFSIIGKKIVSTLVKLVYIFPHNYFLCFP